VANTIFIAKTKPDRLPAKLRNNPNRKRLTADYGKMEYVSFSHVPESNLSFSFITQNLKLMAHSVYLKIEKVEFELKMKKPNLISSRRSSLRVTVSAIHWSTSIWLERNFTFIAAVRTSYLVHFFVSIHSLFQLLICCCAKIASHTLTLRG
jgi:hypothetical protein